MVISRPIQIPSLGDDDYVAGQKTRAKTHRVEYDGFDVVCFERGAKDGSELVANNKSGRFCNRYLACDATSCALFLGPDWGATLEPHSRISDQ